ncbi:MAG: SpoIIE family protein phosphatase [Solobacterium sp.]|nr:SpoIIE family protein phosphatase [Solobacterium sp.]
MKIYASLAAVGIIPVIASVFLTWLYRRENMKKLSYMKKQVLTGLVFGVIAILATEFGVPYNGTIVNARDAAPLCAGLIFGPHAGLIAGTIGAVERWFCIYWGVGEFTRTACTISTFLAGVIGAALRKYMFDDSIPGLGHSVIVAGTVEIIHMLMIFLMRLENVKYTFEYVQVCSIPMIIMNTLAVTLSVYLVRKMDTEKDKDESSREIPTISALFQKRLAYIVFLAFLSTSILTYVMQNQIAEDSLIRQFNQHLTDTGHIVENQYNRDVEQITRSIVEEISWEEEDLSAIGKRYGVYEINIFSDEGVVVDSSKADNIGRLITGKVPFSDFYLLKLSEGEEFITVDEANEETAGERLHYCIMIKDGKIYEIGLEEKHRNDAIEQIIPEAITEHWIGEAGGLIFLDENYQVGSATNGLLYDSEIDGNKKLLIDIKGNDPFDLFTCLIGEEEYYCMYQTEGTGDLVAVMPVREADFSKSIAIYLNFFLLSIVFATLFIMIFISIRYLIVRNIRKVNDSLSLITDGKLDTVVDVRSSKEFIALSDDINTTVDTLKHYIAEANARIDTELKYAREIQSSALPSVFPEREEIDLYALMNPAREVGGDFYDFYFIDPNRLAFMVADVSGKGIPASLFMMRAKTILKTYAENSVGIADIFTNVNYQLCEGNDATMFVTAWMGILDLKTGELQYVNAGHNQPLIRRNGGSFEFLQGPAGFVLAGMDGIVYKQQTLTMEPGDEIFLYTDGVVEATNAEMQLYGDERLQSCLNEHAGEDAKTLCESVRKDVDQFYDGAPQFDDITELSMKFISYSES